jgi:hypothetical protein
MVSNRSPPSISSITWWGGGGGGAPGAAALAARARAGGLRVRPRSLGGWEKGHHGEVRRAKATPATVVGVDVEECDDVVVRACRDCPGRKPPKRVVKHPAHLHKAPYMYRFTVRNTKAV